MDKDDKVIGVIVLIVVALIFYQNANLFTVLDDSSTWNSKLLSSTGVVAEFRSNQPYGEITYVCYAGQCEYTTGVYHLVADSCYSDGQPI